MFKLMTFLIIDINIEEKLSVYENKIFSFRIDLTFSYCSIRHQKLSDQPWYIGSCRIGSKFVDAQPSNWTVDICESRCIEKTHPYLQIISLKWNQVLRKKQSFIAPYHEKLQL